jgi:uracil-DNA glycosylase
MQDAPTPDLDALLARIAACRLCRDAPRGAPLPHEPRPVVRFSATARLLIAGQAPGVRVHRSGLPFDDPSGARLRDWMGIDRATFYDTARIAIAPMGFCFPGLDPKGGDLPPRPECRAAWHDQLFALAPQIETILVVGSYAQAWHLKRLGHARIKGEGMTALVRRWRDFAGARPRLIPLPHPSWRNSGWLKRNSWFEAELVPELRALVRGALGEDA